jgi:hypothetical protein
MEQTLGSSSVDVLDPPVKGGRSLTSLERRTIDLSAQIPGWGSDLDPQTRPGVPRDHAPEIGVEQLYPPFKRQPAEVLILKSTEHGQLPPVFGTTCPPRGLSGWIRRAAYTRSEGRLSRWLLLMFADRVDVVEGILVDLVHLRLNPWREMGLGSELRYNRRQFFWKIALSIAFIALLFLIPRMVDALSETMRDAR